MKSKILIISLTHNRPKILKRCISTAIKHSKIAADACWIIIDDSDTEEIQKNLDILKIFANSGLDIIHIPESKRLEIFEIISTYTLNNDHKIIFEKSYHRDISGLRNFGLFLNFVFKSDLTFFIDDDMIGCTDSGKSKMCYFDHVHKNYINSTNHIIGSTLVGILDESYIGRFTFLINHNVNSIFEQDKGLIYSDSDWCFKKNPLWIDSVLPPEKFPTHTSAGLFGFKLSPNSVIPFPSGYNEDWNWCLLQTALHGTKINITKQTAFHSPPSYFKPKQEGILWEMIGECIFEFILQVIKSNNSSLTLRDIETKIKPNDEINRKIDSLDTLMNNMEKCAEYCSQLQKQKLKDYLNEINDARNSLENSDMSSLVRQWFDDLSKRNSTFSSIINNKMSCKHVRKSLEFVKKENLVI